jgi:hypothetical protein
MATSAHKAQELKLIRSDVDSSRFSFVTATYLFGVDVQVVGLDSCTGVSFDLNYTNSANISFSESRNTPFGFGGKGAVVIDKKNLSDNSGSLYVGVLSGESSSDRGWKDPVVIHLEFAVSQNSTNGEKTTFSFANVQAVKSGGDKGEIVSVKANPIDFAIHSFIKVWPGDANNDGVVDTKDVSTIGRFIGYGSGGHLAMRSFKRPNASVIWAAQNVLAWDSSSVTYADCDGNGDVTVTDQLIVALNFGKTHDASLSLIKPDYRAVDNISENEVDYSEFKKKKLYINSTNSFLGAAGSLRWIAKDGVSKVIDVVKGDIFNGVDNELYCKIGELQNSASIFALNTEKTNRIESKSGALCTLIVQGDPEAIQILDQEFYAVSEKNGFFKINPSASSGVDNSDIDNTALSVACSNMNIELKNNGANVCICSIFDYSGVKVASLDVYPGESVKYIAPVSGAYFIKAWDGLETRSYKTIAY